LGLRIKLSSAGWTNRRPNNFFFLVLKMSWIQPIHVGWDGLGWGSHLSLLSKGGSRTWINVLHASSKEKKNKSQVTEEGRLGSDADWSCRLWLLTVLVWRGSWRWLKNYHGRRSAAARRKWAVHWSALAGVAAGLVTVGELRLRREASTYVFKRSWETLLVCGGDDGWMLPLLEPSGRRSWFLSWGWRRRSVAAVGVSIERRLGHEVEELVMGEEEVEEETRLVGQLKKWCRGWFFYSFSTRFLLLTRNSPLF